MEIEVKYLIKDKFTADRIMDDGFLQSIKDDDSEQIIPMHAIYFDTADGDLARSEMAFRIRLEGQKYIATTKWGGSASKGLHIREEINVPVDESIVNEPKTDIFKESKVEDLLTKVVGEKKLLPQINMEYVRRQYRIDTGKSISVISIDIGSIEGRTGQLPILELEIELYSGDENDLISIGEKLAQKYNMEASNVSKYERGLRLI